MADKLERRTEFYPGFDRRDPDPKKNYGIDGGSLGFYVIGPKGAIQFTCSALLYPPHVREEMLDRACDAHGVARDILFEPMGYDLGYHAREPQYEGQKPMQRECTLMGGTCYYDGSSLQAAEWMKEFMERGTEWLWPRLEQLYRDRFEQDAA